MQCYIDGGKKDINILRSKNHKIIHKTDVPYTVQIPIAYSYSSGPNVFHIVFHKKYEGGEIKHAVEAILLQF